MRNSYRKDIFDYVAKRYETQPEYLWQDSPQYAVLRNKRNAKWYAIVMNVAKEKLGLHSQEIIDIINIQCDPIFIGSLLKESGYVKAYHMNKEKWITVFLDGTVPLEEIKSMIDFSYEITDKKK